MNNPTTEYAAALDGWAIIHRALRRGLDSIVKVSAAPVPEEDRAAFADYVERFLRFLHVHHDGEEEIIFPIIAKAAERASRADLVGHVSGWKTDHSQLLVRLEAMGTACAQFRAGGAVEPLGSAAIAVRDFLYPHLAAEEESLTATSMEKIMSVRDTRAMVAAAAKHGQTNGGPKVLMFVVHNLTAEEQRAVFSEVPWPVRKILFKRIFARNFVHCRKYAHSQSIAL